MEGLIWLRVLAAERLDNTHRNNRARRNCDRLLDRLRRRRRRSRRWRRCRLVHGGWRNSRFQWRQRRRFSHLLLLMVLALLFRRGRDRAWRGGSLLRRDE